MAVTNNERISRSLTLLREGIAEECIGKWKEAFGDDWLQHLIRKHNNPPEDPSIDDVAFLLVSLKTTWKDVFGTWLPQEVLSLVFEVSKVRNEWAHQASFSSDDTLRALDSMERLLEAFGITGQRNTIKSLRRDLMRQTFDEESRGERRKTAARPTDGQPLEGLTPWREIISPHADVAAGRFEQAEFAADLYEVATGQADSEYQDPHAFFSRTYLTEGLKELLVNAAKRLSGIGGDPVIELQTNFGGGKTHSLIALYHLASPGSAQELPGISDVLAEMGLQLPDKIARAAIVGQKISSAKPKAVEDGIELHTIWGHLAYQLGGKEAYELVRIDDENGTSPGSTLGDLFETFGPAIILIDEWVAYARQLRDESTSDNLCGGSFDTQFTFAQALTEAARAASNVVVLVSIPSSGIEVGGERGRTALEKLKNVVTRIASQWQPALPNESFEIVKRRLFEEMPEEKTRIRDGVIRAFIEMYKKESGEFPSGTDTTEYRRRMELSYPIHPELFDRLFADWSALDKFQRTRGVLRLMAIIISNLWVRNDQSLLIMPGNLPMDSNNLIGEMKKYLEEGWDPVIKSDVDGENSLPLRIDGEHNHFGALSATRRVARAIYLSSSPGIASEHARGISLDRVLLGCIQPGEPSKQFADALTRLEMEATHLYVDGTRYWYSLQPNVNRLARERSLNISDYEADEEIKKRLVKQSHHGEFSFVHVFAEGPGDVPDDARGARLVVLTPKVTHSKNDTNSPAYKTALHILETREAGPRLHRNMLVFAAAAANRVDDLRYAVKLHLAWRSIVDDSKNEDFDLTMQNKRQSESMEVNTSEQAYKLISETFTIALVPTYDPDTSELTLTEIRVASDGNLAERISAKLISDEKLIASYSGIRMRMDIDSNKLWQKEGEICVEVLWSYYTRFLQMPRLSSYKAFTQAISDGTANTNWENETFAYSDNSQIVDDIEIWLDPKVNQHCDPENDGYLLHPDIYLKQREVNAALDSKSGQLENDGMKPSPSTEAESKIPGIALRKRFYASFNLDRVRGIKELGRILDDIAKPLGNEVKLSLEIESKNDDGFDDATCRIILENATQLGATDAEFE